MSSIRAVIFDADGVLILPPKLFSQVYSAQHGLDPASLEPFFAGEFQKALRGQADLKDLIAASPLWGWKGDPADLLDQWFAAENYPNHELIKTIHELRAAGMPVYLATSQERHRGKYLRNVMFPGLFDEMFISSELGCTKDGSEFWRHALERIGKQVPGIKPAEIIYFDDSKSHLEPAARAGIAARLYEDTAQVRKLLRSILTARAH